MSMFSASLFDHGNATSQSRYVRTIECSVDESGMPSSRRSSFVRLLLDFLGHLRVGDRLAQLVELALRVVLAELLLDRLQLLAQHVLALPLVELALRLLADLARQLQHLDAVRQELDDAVEPVANLERLEDGLLLGSA